MGHLEKLNIMQYVLNFKYVAAQIFILFCGY